MRLIEHFVKNKKDKIMQPLNNLYNTLLSSYGSQGWWPILSLKSGKCIYNGISPDSNKTFFEIVLGAILTQSVSFSNVEKALLNLKHNKQLSLNALRDIAVEELAEYIKPTGYYNQKAIKVKNFITWYNKYNRSFLKLKSMETLQLRDELLTVKGIGPETAYSIILYCLSKKIFVIDAYTKRLLSRVGIILEKTGYSDVQELFHKNFKGDVNEYKEFHALIVQHCKKICKKKPDCVNCFISCSYKGKS